MALVENAHRYVIETNLLFDWSSSIFLVNSQQDQIIDSRDFSLLPTRLIHQPQILIIIRLLLFKIQPFLQHTSNNCYHVIIDHLVLCSEIFKPKKDRLANLCFRYSFFSQWVVPWGVNHKKHNVLKIFSHLVSFVELSMLIILVKKILWSLDYFSRYCQNTVKICQKLEIKVFGTFAIESSIIEKT